MINLKEHIKLTGVYTFFAAFPAILQLIVYPIIEGNDRLGAEDFGYLAITEAIISFLVLYSTFGMVVGISRFYFDVNNNKKELKELIFTILTGIISRGLLLIAAAYVFSDFWGSLFTHASMQDFLSYGIYLPIIALNRSIIAVFLALFRTDKALKLFIIVSLCSGLFRSIFQIIGVLYLDLSFSGYLAGTAIGGGVAAVIAIVFVLGRSGFQFSFKLWKKLTVYTIPLFLADCLLWGVMFFDRFLLMKNPVSLGIYDNAMKLAIGIQLISQGLAASVQPELFRMFKDGMKKNENDIKTLSNLFISENILLIGFAVMPLIIFISFFYETELQLSAEIIPIILMKYVLIAQYQIFVWPVFYQKATKAYFLLLAVVLVVLVASNLILVPIYSFYGSIFSFLLASLIQVILFKQLQTRTFPIQWNNFKVMYYPIIIVLIVSAADLFRMHIGIDIFSFGIFVTLLIFSSLLYVFRKEIIPILLKIKFFSFLKK